MKAYQRTRTLSRGSESDIKARKSYDDNEA